MPENAMAMVSGMQDIEQLLSAVATGDMAAFRALYDLAAGRLLAIAMKILRDREAAEDAVQEAFLRIWRKAGSYDAARGSPLAWMSIIARNAALDHIRRRCPAEEIEAIDVIDLAVQPVEPPDARLGQCLGRLPADQARAIVTMYTYGLSHAELAEQLVAPLGTVKSWVRRGTQSPKECMES